MPAQDSAQIVRFGDFELDLRAGELRRSGIRLPVQGRPLQVLAVLLRSPGEVVTGEQLRAELWPADTFVDFEHGVHNAVARLRAVLRDNAEKPRYIETLARRGYRFIGALQPEPAPSIASKPHEIPWRILAIGVFSLVIAASAGGWAYKRFRDNRAGSQITSLAVLPLENLSGDSTQDYFADGITDELITTLAKISSVKVISRTSIMQYKGVRNKGLPQIAQELGVNGVLEGTVVRSGDQVRLTAQLIFAPADRHVWAERYERNARDILVLENEVARAIAAQIRTAVTPEEHAHLSTAPQVDPGAYQLYLKGRYLWSKRNQESLHKAIDYFSEALAKDPNYAAAYSGMADCYSSLGFSFDGGDMAPNDAQPKALEAAQRAIALDDSLAEAHTSLAFIKLHRDFDWTGSETEFRRAIALNPGWPNGHHWYAHRLIAAGRIAEAEAESRRALELDPLNPMMNVHMGWHYMQVRQPESALEQFRKALELDPNHGLAYWYTGLVYEQLGRYGEALRNMIKGKELLPGNRVVYSDIGHAYAISGNRPEATKILTDLKQRRARSYVSPFEFALIYTGLGQKEEAFRALDQAYREHADMLVYLRIDSRLDPLRSDARFDALARKIAIPQ